MRHRATAIKSLFSFEQSTPIFKSKEQILVSEKWLLQPSVFTINMDIANLVKGAEDIISMSFVKIAHAWLLNVDRDIPKYVGILKILVDASFFHAHLSINQEILKLLMDKLPWEKIIRLLKRK